MTKEEEELERKKGSQEKPWQHTEAKKVSLMAEEEHGV